MNGLNEPPFASGGWVCPLCFSPLNISLDTHWKTDDVEEKITRRNKSWRCESGHCFDEAKQGYLNLLPVQKKGSLSPGDNNDMIAARHRFLNDGYYQDLSDEINRLVFNKLGVLQVDECKGKPMQIVDIGCGEGYYLNQLLRIMESQIERKVERKVDFGSDSSLNIKSYGIDISKAAIKRAAMSVPNAQFAVASSHNIPLADHSCDLAFTVFAPVNSNEIKRILTKSGYFIRVSPGPRHLYELKSLLYKEVKLHEPPKILTGFNQVETYTLSFKLILDNNSLINDFLLMTPLNWNKNQEAKSQILVKNTLILSCDFLISMYSQYE